MPPYLRTNMAVSECLTVKTITSKDAQIAALVVTYEPIFEIYPYLVLSDRKSASWDNRHGLIMFYVDRWVQDQMINQRYTKAAEAKLTIFLPLLRRERKQDNAD